VAALMLLAPAQAVANPGDTFAEAKVISPGDASFGPINPNDVPVWHVYTSTALPPSSVTLSACDVANFDSQIIVSTGPDDMHQTTIPGGDAENGCGSSNRARLKFQPAPSTTYYIRVLNHDTSLHTYNLTFNVTPANDDLANALVLPPGPATSTQDSSGATKEVSEPDHGGVSPVAGDNSLWYSWTSPALPVTATVNACASNVTVALGVYTGSTYGTLAPVTPGASSNQCKTVFTTATTTTYRFAVAGINDAINPGGRDGQFHISVATPPANDDVAGAQPLTPVLPIDVSGDNSGATLEPSENHNGYDFSIWYSWTPFASGPVAIDTCDPANVSLDRVDLYTTSGAPTTSIASADTGCGNGNGKLITTVTAGTQYLISISSAGFGGATRLKIDTSTAPPSGGGATGGGATTPPTATPPAKKKCKKKRKHASAAKKCKKKKKH
jgi:hypothetical protein